MNIEQKVIQIIEREQHLEPGVVKSASTLRSWESTRWTVSISCSLSRRSSKSTFPTALRRT